MGIEHLAKLNPKTAKLETVGFGKGLITWENVAGALAGLPVQCTWFAYALLETQSNDAPGIKQKYTNLLRDYLASLIWSEMLARKYEPRLKTIGEMAQGIAKAVVHCALNSAGHCARCDGKRWVLVDGAKTDCKVCGGRGDAEFSNGDKYSIAFPCEPCNATGWAMDNGQQVKCKLCKCEPKKVSEKDRKFYQHQCQVYDRYASQALRVIIAEVDHRLDDMVKNALGWEGYPNW